MTPYSALHRALEVAHFAQQHRASPVVITLIGGLQFEDILLDLRLLGDYSVRAVLVTSTNTEAHALVAQSRLRGLQTRRIDPSQCDVEAACRDALSQGAFPLVSVSSGASPDDPPARFGARLARLLGARRLLVLHPDAAPWIKDCRPHLTAIEARDTNGPTSATAWWRFLADQVDGPAGLPGAVLLPGHSGAVFEELFTHHGAGVLVGDSAIEGIRPAQLDDVADVELLMRTEVERGVLRPIGPHEIPHTIQQHLVYGIDGFVVGTARLAPYGTWAELSRFAMLPRYRGRGRARKLGDALIEWAPRLGFTNLFALSIDARMWRFFETLGFSPIDRSQLPTQWRSAYDMRRPSRAYHRSLSS